jgi:hypothetical protein
MITVERLKDLAYLLEAEARQTAGAAQQQRSMVIYQAAQKPADGETVEDKAAATDKLMGAVGVTESVAVRLAEASAIISALARTPDAVAVLYGLKVAQ